jgi:uncharacterized membrane protein HdeD (DUF308 family)
LIKDSAMTTASSDTLTRPPTVRLYLVRAVIALIWAALLAIALHSAGSLTPAESVPALAIALLILYPVIDVAASLLDFRTHGTTAQLVNAGISTVTAIAIAVGAGHGADAILRVFGAWALLTGVIQLALGILRRRRGVAGQWPMMLSGGISTVAGLGFIQSATKTELSLSNLAGYATLGAIFFLVSAWRQHSAASSAAPAAPVRTVGREA